jgi:hypothetical protein
LKAITLTHVKIEQIQQVALTDVDKANSTAAFSIRVESFASKRNLGKCTNEDSGSDDHGYANRIQYCDENVDWCC